MGLRQSLPLVALVLTTPLAGCGEPEVNPPTRPAQPIVTPEAEAPAPAPPPGVGTVMPGSGPQTFVGRWAANARWCARTTGAERPIDISTTRFEGYENSCGIIAASQVADGYEVSLACAAEGQTSRERVRMSVQGDAMRLVWLNRNEATVSLVRCATPDSVPPPS
ncbi:MAG TPA: hypothetical protein VLJ13_03705 [Brevundimonas sp.]|nr:hypothetical protein [Brevundimonas sp.]